MCKQVILTILIIALALRTETELYIWIIQLCPSADRTFVFCNTGTRSRLSHLRPELLPAMHLMWGIPAQIPRGQEENEVI